MGIVLNRARERVRAHFQENFASRGEVGASLSIWEGETEIVSLYQGFRDRARTQAWTPDTMVVVWSSTKGPSAATALLALSEAGYRLTDPVSEIWPELGAEGSLGELLSHQSGLAALDRRVRLHHYDAVIEALEDQTPNWVSGDYHGYHPRTFGFILDELVRRAAGGVSLGDFWRRHIADPLALDFWIGLPESEDHRVAQIMPGKAPMGGGEDAFSQAFSDPESHTRRAFVSPWGLNAVADLNKPENRRLQLPAMGGIGAAGALGRFYAMMAAGGEWEGRRILPEEVCRQAETELTRGYDRTLHTETAFSAGFMKDAGGKRLFGPSPRAFGHPGAGGSLAFADPENGIGFAYVMNQMEASLLPTEKALGLVRALYET